MDANTTPQVGDTWYRYLEKFYSGWDGFHEEAYSIGPKLEVETFEVLKVTPKGVWIARSWSSGGISCDKRFVLLAANKRHAQPSKEEALKSMIARKERQLRILNTQLSNAQKAMALARVELAKQQGVEPNTQSEMEALLLS